MPVADSQVNAAEYARLKALVDKLEAENSALKTKRTPDLTFKVTEKGGVSVYGLGRFPVTLYFEQWVRLLTAAPRLQEFLKAGRESGKLTLKSEQ